MKSPTDSPRPPKFIVDDLFPAYEINLIFGPIIEDNVALMLQVMDDWRQDEPVFGHKSHHAPFCYVSCEQSTHTIWRDFHTVGLDPSDIPHVSLLEVTQDIDRNIEAVIREARKVQFGAQVIFLEGMYTLCSGKINDYHDSVVFLGAVMRACQYYGVTIIGTAGTVKTREGGGYAIARERLPGSGAWSAMPSTKILVEPDKPSKIHDAIRNVTVMSRHSFPHKTYQYAREAGRLIFRGEGVSREDMDGWVMSLDPGTVLTSVEILAKGLTFGIRKSAVYNWLQEARELGMLDAMPKQGSYCVPKRASE